MNTSIFNTLENLLESQNDNIITNNMSNTCDYQDYEENDEDHTEENDEDYTKDHTEENDEDHTEENDEDHTEENTDNNDNNNNNNYNNDNNHNNNDNNNNDNNNNDNDNDNNNNDSDESSDNNQISDSDDTTDSDDTSDSQNDNTDLVLDLNYIEVFNNLKDQEIILNRNIQTECDIIESDITELVLENSELKIDINSDIDIDSEKLVNSEESLKSYDSFDTSDEDILKKEKLKTKLLLLKSTSEKNKKTINIFKERENNILLAKMLENKRNKIKKNKIKKNEERINEQINKEKSKCNSSEKIDLNFYSKMKNSNNIIKNIDDDYLHGYKFF
jgi:hypothetical protein